MDFEDDAIRTVRKHLFDRRRFARAAAATAGLYFILRECIRGLQFGCHSGGRYGRDQRLHSDAGLDIDIEETALRLERQQLLVPDKRDEDCLEKSNLILAVEPVDLETPPAAHHDSVRVGLLDHIVTSTLRHDALYKV
ncbi:hypothetical protein [Novosphingobium naphthalenivorans]|uniref:hypothetical protein n=1 Tax=Novosphingobium naphthalenivorans TaxID=273168 RepID=UPI001FE09247|nr:hypothetical protein [Novosphingobium naphthalenivorans]